MEGGGGQRSAEGCVFGDQPMPPRPHHIGLGTPPRAPVEVVGERVTSPIGEPIQGLAGRVQ
jgi:hypothetical protein